MENKLTHKEIERVQRMYIGCDCQLTPTSGHKPITGKVTARDIDRNGWRTDWWQLLLTPLSALSDEHAVEIAKIFHPTEERFQHAAEGRFIMEYERERNFCTVFSLHQQLILWGYAVPLYFGVGHWANNKTAIELGIAIQKEVSHEQ